MSESTKGVYKYQLHLSIGLIHDRNDELNVTQIGYEPEEWDVLTEEQRKAELEEALSEWTNNYLECSWEAKEDG